MKVQEDYFRVLLVVVAVNVTDVTERELISLEKVVVCVLTTKKTGIEGIFSSSFRILYRGLNLQSSNSNYENCPYLTGKYGMFARWLQ